MSELVVGVDLGGSGMRVRTDGDAQIFARDDRPLRRRDGRIDISDIATRTEHLLAPALSGHLRAERVAIGLTGMPGLFAEHQSLAEMIAAKFRARQVLIASDALTTHLGSLRGRPGAVVAAGTGVIALGTDHDIRWNQIDGWGYILGDLGGGAWIGAQGLRLALLAQDGRPGGSRALRDRAMRRYGSGDALVGAVYGSASPAREIARFAPEVAIAAHEGDEGARDIWSSAGRHLAEAAIAACRSLPPVVSWGGRLFDVGPLLLEPFSTALRSQCRDVTVVAPTGQAVDGALALAQQPPRTGNERYLRVFRFR